MPSLQPNTLVISLIAESLNLLASSAEFDGGHHFLVHGFGAVMNFLTHAFSYK